jgi:3-deoxy-manno-octulosonate cytidylyltransferase (CMP-KDO synthetase)
MQAHIVIPARLASTRLPRKPLVEFGGKKLIEHVVAKAMATGLPVTVATDSAEIAALPLPCPVVVTSSDIATGSDRVAAVADRIEAEQIINLQGDLPFIEPPQILLALKPLSAGYDVGTLIFEMDHADVANRNSVKAVCSPDGACKRCHWFTRAPIAYGYHHAGIYAYSKEALRAFAALKRQKLELAEDLEQIRFLEAGYRIGACLTSKIKDEINTPADLERARTTS